MKDAPEQSPQLSGTLLGVDFGEKRVGVAVGETATGMAHPVTVITQLSNDARLAAFALLVAEWRPSGIVVGQPRHADGARHPVARLAARFAQRLQSRFGLPVAFVDETLSSAEAQSRIRDAGGRVRGKDGIDAHAAAVILQSYLDQTRSAGGKEGHGRAAA